ncbi:MAG: methyl-accepting chemotaxis protein [Negativicutes bacterium]|nr:methyl-accepting chemotaxis protein [Negativicutes bacterium]
MAILESLKESIGTIQELIPWDCSCCLVDAEGVVLAFAQAKTFPLHFNPGDKVPESGSLMTCFRKGQTDYRVLPADIYGFPIKTVGLPVREKGVIVGGISIGLNLERQNQLNQTAKDITANAGEVADASQELANSAAELTESLHRLKTFGESVSQALAKTDSILQFVSDVAANSNLLGLNAAIEAARAGEGGRGFAVVADEIRKMAQNSEKSVNDIKAILTSIKNDSGKMAAVIKDTMILGERQSSATEEISASMQQLVAVATELEKVAEAI